MTERVVGPIQPAHELSADQKLIGADVPSRESRKPPRLIKALAPLFLITLAVAACKTGDANQESPSSTPNVRDTFGFTIPPSDKENLDQALDYIRKQEDAKGGWLIRTDKIKLTAYGGGVPEQPPPDIYVLVQAETGNEYNDIQREWTENLQALFSPLDICKVKFGWNIPTGSFENLGLDPKLAVKTPGCEDEQ